MGASYESSQRMASVGRIGSTGIEVGMLFHMFLQFTLVASSSTAGRYCAEHKILDTRPNILVFILFLVMTLCFGWEKKASRSDT